MLIKTTHGNVLWDCFAYLGDETIEFVSDPGPRTPSPIDKNRSIRTAAWKLSSSHIRISTPHT